MSLISRHKLNKLILELSSAVLGLVHLKLSIFNLQQSLFLAVMLAGHNEDILTTLL